MARDPEELRSLIADWDTYGAVEISAEAIESAKQIQYVPMANGGIQIELHTGGAEVEIEIAPNGDITSVFWEKA